MTRRTETAATGAPGAVSKRYFTERELSLYSGIPVRTLQSWRLRGQGAPWKKLPTGKVLYDIAAFEAFMAACEGGGGRERTA